MIYYRIRLYEFKKDIEYFRNLSITNQEKGAKGDYKSIQWLIYDRDIPELPLNVETINESLAVQIIMQNLKPVRTMLLTSTDPYKALGEVKDQVQNEEDLRSIIHGHYEVVTVEKYEADYVINELRKR